jgi:hypothetical protein
LNITKLSKIDVVLLTFFLLLIFMVSFARGYAFLGSVFSITVSFFSARFLTKLKCKYTYKLLLVPFFFYFSFILYRLSIDLNPNNVFINSRNWISFYGILLLAPYYVVGMSTSKSVKILPALLLVLICFYSLGRMGMLSSLVLLIGVLNYHKKLKYLLLFSLCLVPLFIYYILNFVEIIDIFRLYNFVDDRSLLWNYYIKNIGIQEILFGMDIKSIYRATGYSNLHSSYLHSVYYLGILGYILVILLFFSLFLQLYHSKFSLFLIFLSILLRISTDVGCLCGYFDLSIWMLIFLSFTFGKYPHKFDYYLYSKLPRIKSSI